MPERPALLLTCEHGGNRIPPRYRTLFQGHRRLLESHRGYDRGALAVAILMSRGADSAGSFARLGLGSAPAKISCPEVCECTCVAAGFNFRCSNQSIRLMKTLLPVLVLTAVIMASLAGCSSEPSTNPNPRRTFNAETGNFEGPSPLPGNNSQR